MHLIHGIIKTTDKKQNLLAKLPRNSQSFPGEDPINRTPPKPNLLITWSTHLDAGSIIFRIAPLQSDIEYYASKCDIFVPPLQNTISHQTIINIQPAVRCDQRSRLSDFTPLSAIRFTFRFAVHRYFTDILSPPRLPLKIMTRKQRLWSTFTIYGALFDPVTRVGPVVFCAVWPGREIGSDSYRPR